MTDEEIQAEVQVVILRLQQQEFGLEINKVREIVPLVNITRIPSANEGKVVGVINLRGQVIPVMNLSTLVKLPTQQTFPKTARIVVVEVDNILAGMIVDEVPHVLKVAQKDIQPTPEIIQQKVSADFIEGVGKLDDSLIIMLNVAKLLKPHRNTISAEKEKNNE